MEEILDIYDENKIKTEKKHIRGNNTLKENEYVLVVEIPIINFKDQILLAQRSETKKRNPLKWETTQGSVKSGENSKEAAIRELREELGINISKDELHYLETEKDVDEHIFKDMFYVRKNIDMKEICFSDGEVKDAKWVDINEFKKMNIEGQLANNMNFNLNKIYKIIG